MNFVKMPFVLVCCLYFVCSITACKQNKGTSNEGTQAVIEETQAVIEDAQAIIEEAQEVIEEETLWVEIIDTNSVEIPQSYKNFADSLAKTISEQNADFFNKHFDLESLLKNVTSSANLPDSTRDEFVAGVLTTLNPGEQIASSLGQDGRYRLLRIKNYPESPTALYRLVSSDGLNYHEIYLSSPDYSINQADTDIQINDFYIYMGTQVLSATLKRLYVTSLAPTDSINDPIERNFVENIEKIEEITTLVNGEKFAEALAIIDSLPTNLQKDKMMLIMGVNIAFNVDKEKYEEAVAKFKTQYPNDAVIDLMRLDFSFIKKDKEEVLKAIDELDVNVGGDPYLKLMRANIYKEAGEMDKAERLLQQAIAEEADNEEAHWGFVSLLLDQEKFQEAIEHFEVMENIFSINPAERLIARGYNNFVISDAYKEWATTHPIDSNLLNKEAIEEEEHHHHHGHSHE